MNNLDIEKANSGAQIGEVRTWSDGKKYEKTSSGWVPVSDSKSKKGDNSTKKDSKTEDKNSNSSGQANGIERAHLKQIGLLYKEGKLEEAKEIVEKLSPEAQNMVPTDELHEIIYNNIKKENKEKTKVEKELKKIEDAIKTLTEEILDKKEKNDNKKINKSDMGLLENIKEGISNIVDKTKSFFKSEDYSKIYGDVVVLNGEGKILLLKRTNINEIAPLCWWLPGGHVEQGEEPLKGAFRELIEESNVEADFLIKIDLEEKEGKQMHTYATYMTNDEIILDANEHLEYGFFNEEEIESLPILLDQKDKLIELLKKAKNELAYFIIKEAYLHNQVSENDFLSVLRRRSM